MNKLFVISAVIALSAIAIFIYFKCNINPEQNMEILKVTSLFEQGEMIPDKYGCKGENISAPLVIEGIPKETLSLVIIVDDPDASGGNSWTHWVVFDIPAPENAGKLEIKENSVPGVQGINDFKKTEYGGPCPPNGSGAHRYFFRVYALDAMLNLDEGVTRDEIEMRMKSHILAKGEIMGKYSS